MDTYAELSNIISGENCTQTIIAGDFNCDPNKHPRFFHEFSNFSNEHGMHMCDINNLPPDSYTYVSDNNVSSTSWIDHVLATDQAIISDVNILYGDTFYDHIPLSFKLRLPVLSLDVSPIFIDNHEQKPHIVAWSKVTDYEKNSYSDMLDEIIDNFSNNALRCSELNCSNINHTLEIDELFIRLKSAILEASTECLPLISKKRKYDHIVGWNDICKEAYNKARDHFLLWNRLGRMRSGVIYEAMKESRKEFKQALNFCKSHWQNLRKQKIIESYQSPNKNRFWNDIRKLKPNSASKQIDGATEPSEIINIFNNNYKKILDDAKCHSDYELTSLPDDLFHSKLYFRPHSINEAIGKLNTGLGFDMVHANHLKYSGKKFRLLLGRFLSTCLQHSFLPHEMLMGVIKPVKKGNLCKSNSENYRPVMNSCMIMKTLEYCLLPTISSFLNIDSAQFGFQPGSSCDFAITMVKETIHHYKNKGSDVHAAAIDLAKAYDKVNHDILLDKLRKAKVPFLIVKIWKYIFSNTYVKIRFENALGRPWKIKNGLRQGGCTSALFFSLYINDVLKNIKKMQFGCTLNHEKINIIAFADDIFLLAPSFKGLQAMTDEILRCFSNIKLSINVDKSKYMVFKRKKNIKYSNTLKLDNIQIERVSNLKYLGVFLREDGALLVKYKHL